MSRALKVRLRVLLAAVLLVTTAAAVTHAQRPAAAESPVVGAIRDKWLALGGYSFLGPPREAEQPTFDGVGRRQQFQFGMITWHPSIGAFSIHGDIMTKWREIGTERWGYMITDEMGTPDGVGRYNHFAIPGGEHRSIYWTPATGPQPIFGDFRTQWAIRGWENSPLGYPVTAEFPLVDSPGTIRQNFQKGWLTFKNGATAVSVSTATPVRTEKMVVLRCKYSDVITQPKTTQFYREFFTETGLGTGGFADYVLRQTYGRTALKDSEVKGWFTMSRTLQSAIAAGNPGRIMLFQECVDAAAANGYTPPAGSRVVVAVNGALDGWGTTGRTFLDTVGMYPEFAYHELLHNLLDNTHSWSNDPTAPPKGGGPGEYDDQWDEMSAIQIHGYTTDRYGAGPVGLNAFNQERLGAFTAADIRSVTPAARSSQDFDIEALELGLYPSIPQVLKVNLGGRMFSVEFRLKGGFSRGIPADTVLIHEIKNGTSYLQRSSTGTRAPTTDMTIGVQRIQVISLNASAGTAKVRVSST